MAIQKITYSEKSYINENPSIPATNKCMSVDMNEIKSVVNNNADELETQVKDIYSTSEVQTNKVWVDNKPIYRKVIEFTTSTSNVTSWTAIEDISGLNIDTVVTIQGTYREGTNVYWHPINYYEGSSAYALVMVYGPNLAYKKASAATSAFYMKIELEYTKAS